MRFTDVFWKLCECKSRVVIQQGGTSSSKTWSQLQLLLIIAQKHQGSLISVVSESLPHLKRGAMRDFFKILVSEGVYSKELHNKTDNSYKIGESVIEFFSADNDSKVRGARRDFLYMNECNNMSLETFNQLEVRTRVRAYLDFNPVSQFWVHDEVIPHREHDFIKSTYLDNNQLDPAIIKAIEARKNIDPDWWQVYGLGEVGSVQGIIFTNWSQCRSFPKDQDVIYGLDFGYSNDPTALVRLCVADGNLYVDEVLYQTGLIIPDLAKLMEQHGVSKQSRIIADSASPEHIAQLQRLGYRVEACIKGKDSVNMGIDQLKQRPMKVTEGSLNVIKELRNYKWKEKSDKTLNTPVDLFNHAIDAMRYANQSITTGNKDLISWKIM